MHWEVDRSCPERAREKSYDVFAGTFCGQVILSFMDNYTSVGLFEELEERSILACGTVRSHRVDLPREICNLKSR